jgi:hypothetical protein
MSSSSNVFRIVVVILMGVMITWLVMQSMNRSSTMTESKNSLLLSMKEEIKADQELLSRRLEQYNSTLESLYGLIALLDDYATNQSEIRKIYNRNLKYSFPFSPRAVLTRRLINQYTSSDFDVKSAYNQLVRLHYAQQAVEQDQQGLINLVNNEVWLEFFIQQVDQMTFDRIGDSDNIAGEFRNLVLLYIKEVEVTFLALQGLDKEYSETLEILGLELEIASVKPEEESVDESLLDSKP